MEIYPFLINFAENIFGEISLKEGMEFSI